MVNIKWFYRVCELPENVYQLLVQDRTSEHEQSAVHRPAVKRRELFISDATDTFPVAVLRGRCRVIHYSDVHAVREYAPAADTFFYVLTYNPETRRLASTQGEIRVGPSHQARLPEYRGQPHAAIPPRPTGAAEQQLWLPGRAADTDLLMFLRAARSMAAFAGMCDGGSTEEGCAAASRDDTTQNALNVLHRSAYDQGVALQALVKSPVPGGVQQRWSDEETKKFVKGLRQYGKNFFRIGKELLPHKGTSELVEFYYMWKKTPGAQGNRPRNIARHKRSNGGRRIKSRKGAPKPQGKDDPAVAGCDVSSASEAENDESDDSDSNSNLRDMSVYHCRHCFTTSSKDWHHAGKEHALLCTGCRMHFKKYGELPDVKSPRSAPFPLQRPGVAPTAEQAGRMRTRTRGKQNSRGHRGKRLPTSRAATPSDAGRQSPGSTCSAESSSDKSRSSTSQPQRPASAQATKRPGSPAPSGDNKAGKKKRINSTSAEDSLSDSVSEAEGGTDAPDADMPSSQTSSPSMDDQPTEPEDPPQIKAEPPRPPSSVAKPEPVKPEPAQLEPPEPEPAVVPAETAAAAEPEDPAPAEPHIPAAEGAAAAFTESSSEEDVKPNLPRLQAALAYPEATSGSPTSSSPARTSVGAAPVPQPPPMAVENHPPPPPQIHRPPEQPHSVVKQEPVSDSDDVPRPAVPPAPPLVVKQEPRSVGPEEGLPLTAVLTTQTLTTPATAGTIASVPPIPVVHPVIPPLPAHPPMPTHPGQPLYPQGYPYGYPYQPYGYPYPGYHVRPAPAPAVHGEMLDLRKSDPSLTSKETPTARNTVSVVTRTCTSQVSPASTSTAPVADRGSPRPSTVEHPAQSVVSVSSTRPPYPYQGYPPGLVAPGASVHIGASVSVSATASVQLSASVGHPDSTTPHRGPSAPSLGHPSSVYLSASSSHLGPTTPSLASTSTSSHQMVSSVHYETSQSSSHHSISSSLHLSGVPVAHPPSVHMGAPSISVVPPSVPVGPPSIPVGPPSVPVGPPSVTVGPPSVIAQAPPAGGPPPLISRLPTSPPPPPPTQPDRRTPSSPAQPLSLVSPSSAHAGPPSTQALPPTIVPTVTGYHDGKSNIEQVNIEDDDDVTPSPPIVRPPSPEPKIEDSECHRSQSAIFLRHLNRGESNSCARTDMTFKPVPDSKLARRREERQRRLGERQERERAEKERQQQQQARKEAGERREKESPRTPGGEHPDRLPIRPSEAGLPRLSEYGRPLSVISPGSAGAGPLSSGAFPMPPHMDPMYAMAAGLPPGMYPPRDRMELEMLERREREIRERDVLNERIKEEMLKSRPLDPHWLEMQRRQMIPGMMLPPGVMYPPPPSPAVLSALERERLERLGASVPLPPSDPAAGDRLGLNMADPMVRLQMAGMGMPVPPEYHSHAHAHTHSHSHAHTHLHLHPGDAAAAAAAAAAAGVGLPGLPPGMAGYGPPRPGMLPPRPGDPLFPPGYPQHLARSYEEQLAQLSAHAAAQEHLQRHMLERERMGLSLPPHGMPPTSLHSSLLAQQAQQQEEYMRYAQEEYMRLQREREKRALEEASRGPPKP